MMLPTKFRAIIALRNRSVHPQSLAPDLRAESELPEGGTRPRRVTTPHRAARFQSWTADQPVAVNLKPFEVLIRDLRSS